jgi:2-methylisocitrate lyase-like PEP mutase family enzyme
LDAAIARAKDFIKAGAEAVFIELKSSPELLDQIRIAAGQLPVPCMVNMSIDTRLMALPVHDWLSHGVSIGIFPALARSSFGHALMANLDRLRLGDIEGLQHHSLSAQDYADILGINQIEQWEQRFGVDSPEAPPLRKP